MFVKDFPYSSSTPSRNIYMYPIKTVEGTLYCIYAQFLLDGWMIAVSLFRFYTTPFAQFLLNQEINRGAHKVSISHQSLHRASGTSCPSPGKSLPEVSELCSKKQWRLCKRLFKFLVFSCLSRILLLFWAICLLYKTALPQTVEQKQQLAAAKRQRFHSLLPPPYFSFSLLPPSLPSPSTPPYCREPACPAFSLVLPLEHFEILHCLNLLH